MPGLIDWLRERGLDGSEGDGDEFLCHCAVVLRKLDDMGDLLAEYEEKDGSCAVPGIMSVAWLSAS